MEQPRRVWSLNIEISIIEGSIHFIILDGKSQAKYFSPDMIYDRVMEPVGNELRRLCNEVQLAVNQQRKGTLNK